MARGPLVLVVDPRLGFTNVDQFPQYARRKGAEVSFSTAGAGSSIRLSMELFRSAVKIDTTFISYKGGAPAVNAILGGHVTGMLASIGVVLNQVRAGKLTALGVSSGGKRSPLLPAVPLLSDTAPGFDAQSWVGMSVPMGTPRPTVDRLNAAVVQSPHAPDAAIEPGLPVIYRALAGHDKARQQNLSRDNDAYRKQGEISYGCAHRGKPSGNQGLSLGPQHCFSAGAQRQKALAKHCLYCAEACVSLIE